MADEDIVSQFASLILRKECEVEKFLSSKKPQKDKIKKVEALIGTYSEAIQYYQSVDSDLYIELNERMQKILTRAEVLKVLDEEAVINAKFK